MGKTREKLDASLTPVPTHVNNHQSERQTHCLIRKVLAFFFLFHLTFTYFVYMYAYACGSQKIALQDLFLPTLGILGWLSALAASVFTHESFYFCFVSEIGVFLCSPSWSGTHSPPGLHSCAPGVQMCTTT